MNCTICKKPLSGFQKKYCSDSCATYVKQIKEKRKWRVEFSKIACLICGGVFQQKRNDHVICSINCRIARRKLKRGNQKGNFYPPPLHLLKTIQHSKPHFNSNCSDNKKAILAFLASGGKITKFPNAKINKTPAVNLGYGWIPDELIGTSLMREIDEMDKNG